MEQFYDDIFESSYGKQFDPVKEQAIAGMESGSTSEELIHVYRGTNRYAEIAGYNETGQLMSDATRNLYFETANLDAAYAQSGSIHDNWLKIWGNQNDYV